MIDKMVSKLRAKACFVYLLTQVLCEVIREVDSKNRVDKSDLVYAWDGLLYAFTLVILGD